MGGSMNPLAMLGGGGASSGSANAAGQNAQTITGQINALQPQQTAFGQQLASQAAGTAPSISGAMLQQANDTNLANQQAQAKSNRAVNPALAQRNMMQQAGQQNQQTAQAAGIQRLQEQQANQGQFASYLNNLYAAQNGADKNSMAGAGAAANTGASGLMGLMGNMGSIGNMFGGGGGTGTAQDPMQFSPDVINAGASDLGGGAASAGDTFSGAGNALSTLMPAHGGQIGVTPIPTVANKFSGPQSKMGQRLRAPAMPMQTGGTIPGQASVAGDSYANDKVHAMLSPGEVVIPRSVMSAKDPAAAAAKFVAAVMKRNKGKKA